ncbi:MAG: DUF5715 family protein [Bacteroidales bacterium]
MPFHFQLLRPLFLLLVAGTLLCRLLSPVLMPFRSDAEHTPNPHIRVDGWNPSPNRPKPLRYASVFNDLNSLHVEAGKKKGIIPLASREALRDQRSKLKEIRNSKYVVVEKLTHSVPYLTPDAADLLETIGKRFNGALRAKGMTEYALQVTSLLRTDGDAKSLRRSGNVNASANSSHRYATTFDITYVRFKKISRKEKNEHWDHLRMVLGEVLLSLREEEKCYVKYEIGQKCFHITAR